MMAPNELRELQQLARVNPTVNSAVKTWEMGRWGETQMLVRCVSSLVVQLESAQAALQELMMNSPPKPILIVKESDEASSE